jgi:hypothetical protein
MSKYTVTVIDTTGIQSYVFGSNRLRENIGASYLLAQATGDWVEEILEKNVGVPKAQQKLPIESSNLSAELVYAGGGNAMVIFRTHDFAIEFTRKLSKKVLHDAPGVNLVVAHGEFDWDADSLYEVVQELMKNELDRKKYGRIPSAPLLGLGVTTTCNSTQLPAIGRSDEPKYKMPAESKAYLVSRETGAKLQVVNDANVKLKKEIFQPETLKEYKIALDFDDFGRTEGESSYLAIVHADGNSMGERFQKIGEGKGDREYINALRNLSKSVNQAGINALKEITKILVKSIHTDEDGKKQVKGQFEIKDNFLPFRPIVYGGDDVTFVCEGRLGLELAALYLQKLQEQPIADGEKLKACAGISIVKTHYPFARSYELSEALCREAKRYVKQKKEKQKKEGNFAALDWHIAASGLSGSIQEIREREYHVKIPESSQIAHLEMRPVRLEQHQSDWHTWEGFTTVVKEFNKEGGYWKERRNKVINLREILRKGSGATKEFLNGYRLQPLPLIPDPSGRSQKLAQEGWLDVCGYFDAIEAMEFYISLGEETDESISPENPTAE